jgi:diadenosine tetraphosphate (Ap4A) HIT family hydrolase
VLADDHTHRRFRETFQLEALTIQEADGWILSVRPAQLTLGAMVISSARGHLDFQQLDPQEAGGLAAAVAVAERLAKEELGAVRINLACLMMKDPVVHFHVLPRYDRPIERYDITWEDQDWPGPPTFSKVETPQNVLEELVADLKPAVV